MFLFAFAWLAVPLARKIVLQHGGTLSISGRPNEGAVVSLEFFVGTKSNTHDAAPEASATTPIA